VYIFNVHVCEGRAVKGPKPVNRDEEKEKENNANDRSAGGCGGGGGSGVGWRKVR